MQYLPIRWIDQDNAYYGIIVQVPSSQMVLEIMAKNSSSTSVVANHPKLVPMDEVRASRAAIARAEVKLSNLLAAGSSGDTLEAIVVNRAASDLNALDAFYAGMQTTTTLSSNGAVSKRCYLWTWATVDVCFTTRPANATSTSFSVADFEGMLMSTHQTVVTGGETCNNKWADNHYAIDGDLSTSAEYIVTFMESNPGIYYYCESVNQLHYIVDPTGWGVQLDLEISTTSTVCASSRGRKLLQGPPPPPPPGDDSIGDDVPGGICPCTGMTLCGVTS